ncbi:chlorogenic acid esterase precursor, partial [Colletotrichum musicola]
INWPAYTAEGRLVRTYGENNVTVGQRALASIEQGCADLGLL